MFRRIVLVVGGLASLATASLMAQEAVLSQEYGAGVHAFFAGDFTVAHQHLTSAIVGGSKDPRAFYFRGLACLKLGRGQDAVIDFRKGAELESSDVNRFYDVGKALERVQGAARAELEKYRVAARMAALEQAERLRKARYEAMQREESRVLRQQAKQAPSDESEATPPAAAPDEDDNPFATPGDELTRESTPKSKHGKKASPKAGDDSNDNPFETDQPKADKKPKTKPNDKAKKPDDKAKKPDDKNKKKADEDDPFAGDEPAAPEKPKTDKPKAEKPKTEKPKAGEKRPDEKKDKGKKDEGKKDKKSDAKDKKPEKKPDEKSKKGDAEDPFA